MVYRVPIPTLTFAVSDSPAWFSLCCRPLTVQARFILSSASIPPQSFSALNPPSTAVESSFLGVSFPIATSISGVHSRRRPRSPLFRPRRFARPRRFPPPLTLQVYFTLLPRPGFALQGFPLTDSRTSSHSPLPSCCSLSPPTRSKLRAPETKVQLQGLAPSESPLYCASG